MIHRHRAPVAALLCALVVLLAGCGGGNDGVATNGSLGEPLSYLPKNSALVATFQTDTSGAQFKNIERILGKFPFGGQVQNQIVQSLAQSGADYYRDVKPLLGNEIVVGLPDARSLTDQNPDTSYIVAFQSRNGDKLRAALAKSSSQRKSGKFMGTDVWESNDGSVVAVKGATLIAANDRITLQAALKRHDGGGKLTEQDFDAAFAGLPTDPLARVTGDAQALLASDPQTAPARKVKWVGGLRRFAATAQVEGDGVLLDARVATQGVGPRDLPIAAGDGSPALARSGDYSMGQRDLAQTLHFSEATAATVDPAGFAKYDKEKRAIGRKLGIDLERDVIDQLSGDTTVAGTLDGSWSLRGGVKDPRAMRATLAKLARAGKVGDSTLSQSDGLIKSEGSGSPSWFGMVGDVFVAGPTPAAARQIATVQPKAVPGVKGATVFVADGEAIAKQAIARSGQNRAATLFIGPIGDLVGYVSAAPAGMRAHAKLKIE